MGKDGFGSAKLPSSDLEANVRYLKENIFAKDDTMQFRRLRNHSGPGFAFCLVFADGMANNKMMADDVVRPLIQYRFPDRVDDLMELLETNVVFPNGAERTAEMEKIVQAAVYGDTVLLADGCPEALVLETKGFKVRSIEEPMTERVLRGPREGFNESLLMNLTLLRRKLRTPDLKMQYMTFGRRTRTKACVCYLDSVVDRHALDELKKRLKKVDIDGTLDTEYLADLVRDHPWSGVDTVGTTERPDVVAGKLLEGRVALLLDGTPQVLTVPYLFLESFQSDEDYYLNFWFASIGRLLRILSFLISITFPGIYVALVAFHPEVLPLPLLISISQARLGVPFPTVLEMLFMLVVFEMLRESGARMPGMMGQTLSIVGALVIGQAAVEAKIVSAHIIIVVALTAITGMMNPKIKGFTILVRFVILLMVSMLGLYGFLFGVIGLLAYLYSVESFGTPILTNTRATHPQEWKDSAIRAPWQVMLRRPVGLSRNRVRQKQGGEKK